jgi:hypothetical protein
MRGTSKDTRARSAAGLCQVCMWHVPGQQCGYARSAVGLCQVSSAAMPGQQYGYARSAVQLCQVSSTAAPGQQYGFARSAVEHQPQAHLFRTPLTARHVQAHTAQQQCDPTDYTAAAAHAKNIKKT